MLTGNPFAAALAQHKLNLLQHERQKQPVHEYGRNRHKSDKSDFYRRRSFEKSKGSRRHSKPKYNRSKSAPSNATSGATTPATPRSLCSNDTFLDGTSSMWSYRPPSSIHLRDSIENCLDMNLHTPDNIDSPFQTPSRNSGSSKRHWRRPFSRSSRPISSTSDLQSLREYSPYMHSPYIPISQDSLMFSTASEFSLDAFSRSPYRMGRSNSDYSLSCIPRDLSFPSGYESADSDTKATRDEWKLVNENKRKTQNLLNDIQGLCHKN